MSKKAESFETPESFLAQSHLYRLGGLTTEQRHPETTYLSDWAREDLHHALEVAKRCELEALSALLACSAGIEKLRNKIQAALRDNRNIYICGCGATGRLALSLEYLWREWAATHGKDSELNRVSAFTAGGDLALVRSVESFEDFPGFGERQLKELGFTPRDVLISTTEGGETPFVIGATEYAASVSEISPSFLFCNPAEELIAQVERSRRVLTNPKIDSLSLCVGPMLLSGSTRMQASTVLMLAVGLALLPDEQGHSIHNRLTGLIEKISAFDYQILAPFITREAKAFLAKGHVVYESTDYAMTIFTDTTERHPTFNLVAFENNQDDGAPLSAAYFVFPGSRNSKESWERLLARGPRTLEWTGYENRVGLKRALGYDFSEKARQRRAQLAPEGTHVHSFIISKNSDAIRWKLDELTLDLPAVGMSPLFQHIFLKILLNTHSTLMMGRCGRYQGNVMTWVRPTNGKLIDRAIRYIQFLIEAYSDRRFSYEDVCRALFQCAETLTPDESIVLNTFKHLTGHEPNSQNKRQP